MTVVVVIVGPTWGTGDGCWLGERDRPEVAVGVELSGEVGDDRLRGERVVAAVVQVLDRRQREQRVELAGQGEAARS